MYIYRYVQLYMCGKLRVSHNVSVYICSVHIQRASFELRLPYLGLQPPLVHHLFPTLMAIGSKPTDYSPFLLVKSPYIATDGVSARWNNVFEKKKKMVPPAPPTVAWLRYPGPDILAVPPINSDRHGQTTRYVDHFPWTSLDHVGFFYVNLLVRLSQKGDLPEIHRRHEFRQKISGFRQTPRTRSGWKTKISLYFH